MNVDDGLLVLGREHVWVRHDVSLFSLTNAGRLGGITLAVRENRLGESS